MKNRKKKGILVLLIVACCFVLLIMWLINMQQAKRVKTPIIVYVEEGQAFIVDGHHRYQAFVNLGYERVPIKYIHANQVYSIYGRTVDELWYSMFK